MNQFPAVAPAPSVGPTAQHDSQIKAPVSDLPNDDPSWIGLFQRNRLNAPLEQPLDVYHAQQVEVRHSRDTSERVFVRAHGTVENLWRLLLAYGIRVRYNELARDIEVSIDGVPREGELARNTNLSLIEDLCRLNKYPHTQVAGNIFALAERDSYNPALDWIRSKPWDGVHRFSELCDCLTFKDPSKAQLSWTLFRKWLLGAAAIISGRTNKFEHVLVLVDPNGGIGKTRFFNSLCPPAFQADGVALDVDDKDSVLQVISKWLVELGEIGATFGKSDTEALKAFLSRSSDEVRPPYSRATNRFPRRTAFFGSVNNVRFLVDDTNNRRFWPIEVTAVDYRHSIDMQQVWAEALWWLDQGDAWHASQELNAALGVYNDGFRTMDRVEEKILASYDPTLPPCRHLSASDVLDEIGVASPKRADTVTAGKVLRKLFASKVSKGYTVYHVPFAKKPGGTCSPSSERYGAGPL